MSLSLQTEPKFTPDKKVFLAPKEIKLEREIEERIIKQMEKIFVRGMWHENERVDEPYLYCKKLLHRVCKGIKKDGTPWKKIPGKEGEADWDVLRKRLAVFNYDLDTGERLSKIGEALASATRRIPGELDVDGRIKYSSSINSTLLRPDEAKAFKKFVKKLQEDYPELNSESDALGIDILAMLRVRVDRIRAEIGGDVGKLIGKDSAEMAKLYKDTVESLGIAGKQRMNQIDSERASSVAELVKKYNERLKKFPVEHKRRYLQECELFLQAWKRGEVQEEDVKRFTNLDIQEVKDLLVANKIAVD